MSKVEADFYDGKRIVFTSRSRSSVNVREAGPDGPIGYSSIELLLIAFANCTLGNLTNSPLLAGAKVRAVHATLENEMALDPIRISRIRATIDLEVDDVSLLARREELLGAAEGCPVGNTLRFSPDIEFELRLRTPEEGSQA